MQLNKNRSLQHSSNYSRHNSKSFDSEDVENESQPFQVIVSMGNQFTPLNENQSPKEEPNEVEINYGNTTTTNANCGGFVEAKIETLVPEDGSSTKLLKVKLVDSAASVEQIGLDESVIPPAASCSETIKQGSVSTDEIKKVEGTSKKVSKKRKSDLARKQSAAATSESKGVANSNSRESMVGSEVTLGNKGVKRKLTNSSLHPAAAKSSSGQSLKKLK